MDPDSPEHHLQRSEFIRKLIQSRHNDRLVGDNYLDRSPRIIMQYWHDTRQVPSDVKDCISSWTGWESEGYTHRLFNRRTAKTYIDRYLGAIHEYAFGRCYHPAMQADYFRLCFLLIEGGLYVDADDECVCDSIDRLFEDGRLRAQPLCYDIDSDTMVNTSVFLNAETYTPNWIFYFNNNPLVVSPEHPIIKNALDRATNLLQFAGEDELLEIQSTTGPGNLSKSIFELGKDAGNILDDLVVLRNWESIGVSRWPLSYRSDARNWRLSNQKRFQHVEREPQE